MSYPPGLIRPDEISGRDRYALLTSLVVPRPIAWVSTYSAEGRANLAPFSFFAALSASPLLLGISIGARRGEPKDTLRNVRETGEFCVNVVTDEHLERMNVTSGEYGLEVDEFERAGLPSAEAELVRAPYVAGAPAVFECRLFREVDLGESPNTLVIGEAVGVRLGRELPKDPGTELIGPEALRPVGRLGGPLYTRLGEVVDLPRP